MCVGEIDETVENNLKARFINESDSDYPRNVLHMYAENQPTILQNQIILDDLPGEIYSVEAQDRVFQIIASIPHTKENRKQAETGGLAKSLQLKIGAKVMLRVNIDIQDRLINVKWDRNCTYSIAE